MMKSLEVRELLKRLERSKAGESNLPYIEKIVKSVLNGYQHTTPVIEPGIHTLKLYLAIKYGKKPSHLSLLGCPPPELVKIGRANFANQPVFYCSSNPRATLFELDINPGDTIVLSKWSIEKEIVLECLGYTNETFSKLGSGRICPKIIPEKYSGYNNINPTNKLINKFLNEKFTEIGSDWYPLTAAIAAYFWGGPFNGIIYPSIGMMANADNFALSKLTSVNNLKIIRTEWYKVTIVDSFNKRYTVIPLEYSESFTEHGEIVWAENPAIKEKVL